MKQKTAKLSIAFISSLDPTDRKAWSGILYFMADQLRKEGHTVVALGPIKKPFLLKLALSGIAMVHLLLFRKKYDKSRTIILSFYYSRVILQILRHKKVDIIFAPAASTEIAFLKTPIPICYYSDTSFGQISGYYPEYRNFSKLSIWESNYVEKRAICNAAARVYSSRWAAEFVVNHYLKANSRVFEVKLGANIVPSNPIFLERKAQSETFNLLFLGVDWERKGGEKALKTYYDLQEKGYPVSLTICGLDPGLQDSAIRIFPFLDKNKSRDRVILESILLSSHLLLLPTEADCTPIVINEAAAFGIPVIATDTGGISSQIAHEISGFLAKSDQEFTDYAEILIQDRLKFHRCALAALAKYHAELNWSNWGNQMTGIFHQIIPHADH